MEEEEEEDQNDADRFLSCEALKVPCVCGENARNRIFVCCLLFYQSLLSFFQDYFLLSMSIIQKDSLDIKKNMYEGANFTLATKTPQKDFAS